MKQPSSAVSLPSAYTPAFTGVVHAVCCCGLQKMMMPVVMGSQQQKLSVVLDTGSTTPYTTGFNWQQSSSFVNTSVPDTLV